MPRYTSIVSKLSAAVPFVGPEAIERERGKAFQLRLGANESAFGVSPAAHRAILVRLQERAVFLRMPGVAPLDRCIRVTVGTGKERHLFASIFREVLHELAKDSPQKMSL